ncbi:cupin domain-containing protein [Neptunicella sp. SCSIO 80796]|uniref:cupin domain-containing protein n=1 Tax=Neptunicella plasticusilytica TaxID=3117012 RepID=UPI003A4E36FF
MMPSERFILGASHPVQQLEGGISRQIMGYDEQLMLVKVWFSDDSIGYVHEHFHSQVTYVESGEFEVSIDGEVRLMTAGDSFYIPPHIKHGAVCKKAGVLIDTFSPVRKDFLE